MTVQRHLGLDMEIGTATVALARAEGRQYAAAQALLCVYDQADHRENTRFEAVNREFTHTTEKLETQSSEVAELAHAASEEHEGYEAFVEALSRVTADKGEFAEQMGTLERLVGEGRTAEARKFAADISKQGERSRAGLLSLLGQFQSGSLERVAEHQQAQWRSASTGLACAIAACVVMTIFFRLRLRQLRIDFARRAKEVAPRAEHLKTARTFVDDDEVDVAGGAEQKLAGCRVLAAEDGPHNQRFIKRILTKAGAEVVIAEDGDNAVETTFSALKDGNPYDVVLMDMQMPVMDGMEATQTLRRFHYQGAIVAVSANSHGQNREQCLNAGCDGYLAKPISRDELLAVVEKFYRLSFEAEAEDSALASAE